MTIEPSLQQDALSSIEQLLTEAVNHQQAGELQEAGELYLSILQKHPNHPDANHNMGLLAVQMNQPVASLPYFNVALDADPSRGQYWVNYIDALYLAGQLDDARKIMALARQQGLQGDGVEALAERLEGDMPVAKQPDVEDQQTSTVSSPIVPAVPQNSHKAIKTKHNKLGKPATHKGNIPSPQEINSLVALFTAGRFTEAATLAQSMTERFPLHEFGWKALGAVFKQMGRSADALLPMQKAVTLSPRDDEAHYNLGVTLQELGRVDEAEVGYRRALKINPEYADAYANLGLILKGTGRLDEAEINFRRAIKIKPNYAEAYINLGATLQELGRLDEAEASYRCAIQIDPRRIEAHTNLGSTLKELGRLDEAEASCRCAIQIDPRCVEAHISLGVVLYELGRADEAEAFYRRALEIKPDSAAAFSNILLCLSHNAAVDADKLFIEHLFFGEKFEAPLRNNWPQHNNSRDPDRCLQIGFVSGDFRNHPLTSFIEPILLHLSKYPNLSLRAYSNYFAEDSVTQRLRTYFTRWENVGALTNCAFAEKLQRDGIDILIDLSGHTGYNRLLTFARKPAPVQVSWMGYPGTTGLKAMDYFLSDRFFTPPGQFDDQFTEKIVCLPAGAPFLPHKDAPAVNDLPALSNGHVTFGSFNRLNKLSPSVIALWSQFLRALPDSRMVIGGMPEVGKYETLIKWFTHEGIDRERLDFHTRGSMESYLCLHYQVDICLDTFPYNGGTTTLHALWMGVPTITLAGNTVAGRSGAAVLGNVDLGDFIAHNEDEYVQKGLLWAGNLKALSDIRTELRERFSKSAVGQPEVIAAGLERALRIMWQRWCQGLPAESFEVTQQELVDATREVVK